MPEDLDNPEDETPSEGPKQLREALKREQDRASAAQAELDQFKREAAFREAGVDLTNPLHRAAVKGYDGAADGIKDWVTEIGLTAHSTPLQPSVPDSERERLERIFSASSGDQEGQVPNPTADKDNELRAATEQARREGWTNTRYHDEMRRIVQKYGGAVATLPYETL